MKSGWNKLILGLAMLPLWAILAPTTEAQEAGKYYRTQRGNVHFLGDVVVGGTLTATNEIVTTDSLTFGDLATTDDLDVGDDAHVAGDFDTTGTTTLRGTINGKAELRTLKFSYFDVDAAASQNAAEWGIDTADVGGAFKQIPVPVGGSIIGIAVYSNAETTSGTLTADATVNGTATGLQAGLNSVDDKQTSYTTQAIDADTVAAGARVGVKVTTTSTFTPTTADVVVTVLMEY